MIDARHCIHHFISNNNYSLRSPSDTRINLMTMLHASFFVIFCGMLLNVVEGACPIQLNNFEDSDCKNEVSSTPTSDIHISDSCNFVLGDLYRVYCISNTLYLDPCVTSPFSELKEYALNTCLASGNGGSYQSFVGSCDDDETTTCTFTDTPTTSSAPSMPPKPKSTIADFIQLPSPPLPPNQFADKPLSIELAHEVVFLAGRLVYQMDDTNAASLLPDGYTFHLWRDTGSTEVLIVSTEHTVESEGKIMVVFRGTDDTPDGDWLTNINLPKVPFGPDDAILDGQVTAENYFGFETIYELRVHRGFNNVFSDGLYDTILDVIIPLLQRESTNGELYYKNTIHFFGHSLGGANAQVFGSYFAHFHPQIKTYVTTLGAPRQGNYAYKIFVESRPNLSVWRMVNCRDVVPRVPNFQYYHGGHLMWKKCSPPSSKEPVGNNIVEAYYRQSGDFSQKFAEVPHEFIVNSYENSMISDHFGYAYLEWLGYGLFHGNGKNWTSVFEPIPNNTSAK